MDSVRETPLPVLRYDGVEFTLRPDIPLFTDDMPSLPPPAVAAAAPGRIDNILRPFPPAAAGGGADGAA